MCALYTHPIFDFQYRYSAPLKTNFHTHVNYEVYYFHSGSCTYLIGDRIYVLAPGDLLLMNGMTLHCAKIDPAVEYIRSIIHFEPGGLQPLLSIQPSVPLLQPFTELGNYRLRLGGEQRAEAEALLQRMDDLRRSGDVLGAYRCQLVFAELLCFIYERCRQPLEHRGEQSSEKERTVQQLITYIEGHYTEDLHLDQLQQELHMSKYYASRLFKEVTGVTIFDYVYQRRINQARIEFVLEPKVSVTDVCFKVGFKHLAHFSRVFKKQVGMTPEQYKRSRLRTE
ncbi:AraC family transcriptional regulator [Paenibacillus sp. YYML68]|uniref:AraC family transcriptional regulator n=1 Tax=Paenibacillus sp. YYML68 TaxID=2909250 RepID=UPI002491C09C|nr:AraC family transcriptional regulator [Paenibacillus sp. YYML68]